MKKDRALWIKAGDVVRYAGWEYVIDAVYPDPLRFDLVPAPEAAAGKRAPVPELPFQAIDSLVATKLPADLLSRDYTHVYAPPAAEARLKLDATVSDLVAAEQRINDGLVALGEATDANRRLQASLDAARATIDQLSRQLEASQRTLLKVREIVDADLV